MMRPGLFSLPLAAVLLSVFLTTSFVFEIEAPAQEKDVIWIKPEQMKRVAREGRRRRPGRRDVEQKPFLALKLRMFILKPDGTQVETNPNAPFHAGDRLRLAVTANQEGYLYIIHQPQPTEKGEILFPDSRVDYGQNFVTKDVEFVVPSNCPAGISPRDCAYVVPPGSNRELFTIIFSRDNMDLPAAGRTLEAASLQRYLAQSKQQLRQPKGRGKGGSPYAIWLVNVNRADNEEIIQTFEIAKGN